MTDNDWRILHIAENEPVVMTERVDNMRLGGRPISLPVMGIFEIEKDRINAWRDYFDLATFQRQLPG
jgi:limonene-1,2-epoxide hydrolase